MIKKIIIFFILPLITISCEQNTGKINFKKYPANYKIAYFEEMEIKNIPSVRHLFGNNASFNDEFQGTPVLVIVESYLSDKNNFSAVLLLKVIETEYDIARMSVKFEADSKTKKSYVRSFKIESLLSGQTIEKNSTDSGEQSIETFGYFLSYMHLFWK